MRTFRLLAPSCAVLTSGSEIAITSTDFPALVSPVALFKTLSVVVPTGSPKGTATVSRRKPVAALSVVTAVAVAVTGGPDAGVKVTSLLDAVALKPVPVIEIATDGDAPIGVNDARLPPQALPTPTIRLRTATAGRKKRVESNNSEAQRNNLDGCFTAGGATLRAPDPDVSRRDFLV